MTRILAVTVTLTLLIVAAASAAQPAAEEQRAADTMLQRFVTSWNNADGGLYGENYWDDAELVNPSGSIVNGKAAIVKEHVDLWAGPFHGSHIAGQVRRIRRLGPNYLLVDLDLELSGVSQLPPGAPPGSKVLRNRLKHILERRGTQWKVIAAQNTFVASQ
jgi:uncharacterized protein (TIGR02246 family)